MSEASSTAAKPSKKVVALLSTQKTPRLRKPAVPPRPPISSRLQTPRADRKSGDKADEPDSPTGSTKGSFSSSNIQDNRSLADDEADSENVGNNVKVLVRFRPLTADELAEGTCVAKASSKSLILRQAHHEPQIWTFDHVASEAASQEDMFQVCGQPIVENCIAGYNSSIFCYGQTGAGKTHTMQGSLTDPEQRGLSSRVFEYIFRRIQEEESGAGRDNLRYNCKCSFLEIYNETITDLLKPSATNLQLREDVTRGCFVDGLSEEIILNVEDAIGLIHKGAQNRKIGQTRMNHESSRSHSVFTCTIESTSRTESGISNIRFSRLNLVDLAGSERNKASGATGEQFKEACLINQSLTALGRVIMELVEAQRNKRHGHIPYRDSRLTFLLQDSLGGNAKSMIIANISPAASSGHETLSTLQFVSRAKQIRNKAVVNQDTAAVSTEMLKREVQRLYRELELIRSRHQEPLIEEASRLRAQLHEARLQADEAKLAAAAATSEAKLAKTGARWAEDRVAGLESEKADLQELLTSCFAALGSETSLQSLDLPLREQVMILQDDRQAVVQQLATAEAARGQAQAECDTFSERLCMLEASTSKLEELHRERLAESQAQVADCSFQIAALERENAMLSQEVEGTKQLRAALHDLEQERGTLLDKLESQEAEASSLSAQVSAISKELARRDEAVHAERVAREATIQELSQKQNSLQASFAAAQAEILNLSHSNAELLQRALGEKQAISIERESREIASQALTDELMSLTRSLREAESRCQTVQSDCSTRLSIQEAKAEALLEEVNQLQQALAAAWGGRDKAQQEADTAAAENVGLREQAASLETQAEESNALHQTDVTRLQQAITSLQQELEVQKVQHKESCQASNALEEQLKQQVLTASQARAQAETINRRQESDILVLQTELQTANAALVEARKGEGEAHLKAARLKHMLGEIDSLIKWARSPNGTPTGLASASAPSFCRGAALPSPAGNRNHNPLFVTQRPASALADVAYPRFPLAALEALQKSSEGPSRLSSSGAVSSDRKDATAAVQEPSSGWWQRPLSSSEGLEQSGSKYGGLTLQVEGSAV